ncbi:MAG TPA: thiamine-phosphate kinase [Bryobacteraceae bacterium]|nr:thiamine-phosphate kinase [Bryobacteraceae bacterium]
MRSELQLIDRIRSLASNIHGRGLAIGIGDDCAVYHSPGASEDLLFTTDLLVEDIHFRRETHRPEDIGWKALARGLSDIAAMGGEPRFCLVSLALAPWSDARWLDCFYRGLLKLAAREKTPLAGGDLGKSAKATCDIVVCGSVPRGKALRRDGAKAGDGIYISGELGSSALGFESQRGKARQKHLRPEPRIALGKHLRRLGATAAMDLSDGLSLDLHRLATASRLSAEIAPPPIFRGATPEQALHGGEDYELLFTAPARRVIPEHLEGLRLTRIGTMRKGSAGEVRINGAILRPLGYDHFRKP